MNRRVDYGIKFDEMVSKYNDWLESLDESNSLFSKRNGSNNVDRLFGIHNPSQINLSGSIYSTFSCTNYSSIQKDAIALASDWQRVNVTLDQIISGEKIDEKISVKDAIAGKKFVQDMYDHYKSVYVSFANR